MFTIPESVPNVAFPEPLLLSLQLQLVASEPVGCLFFWHSGCQSLLLAVWLSVSIPALHGRWFGSWLHLETWKSDYVPERLDA